MTEPEPSILVNGVPIPVSMAGKAVARCIRAIQIIDKVIGTQGFASKSELEQIKRGLTGEDEDNAAPAKGVVS